VCTENPSRKRNPWNGRSAEQPPVDEAAELEAAVGQAIEACGGDPIAAVRALIVANAMLEREMSELYAKASHGFLRGPAREAEGQLERGTRTHKQQ
jgi:hypothetical protein